MQDHLSLEGGYNDPAQDTFIAAANTAYYIIYQMNDGCGLGEVTIEASTPPVKYSCSSPYNVSVEAGDTAVVTDIDTCEQDNSNDGIAFETSLSSRDYVILLESSSVVRQIIVSSKSTSSGSDSVQVISQQCSTNQTSDTVEYVSEEGYYNPAQNTFVAAANTAYYIIYETDGECGSGEVTIEAPVQ
eukprot:337382-Pelagomonas_calceolata.AAC.1